jgi:hypothetical protein
VGRKLPATRKFGKVRYHLQRTTKRKPVASREVTRLHKKGVKARLVKTVTYDVYAGPKSKRKPTGRHHTGLTRLI